MLPKTSLWFTKSKRAQNVDDNETWIQGGAVPTMNAFDVGDTRATVLIIDGTRVDDVRIYDDGIVPTVISRYGTGGGNVPMIFDNEEPIAFHQKQEPISGSVSPALGVTSGGMGVVTPIAYSVREDAKANNFSATETDTALTLQGHQPSPQSHHAQLFLAQTSTVRRLTPTECERLQGFPDGWTSQRFDEKKQEVIPQADSNRYKQMGNAVAVPVVEWIVRRLVETTKELTSHDDNATPQPKTESRER